jgi:glycosyltransferase involved in cell wall biosynthesis
MNSEKPKVLVIASPGYKSGGQMRTLRSIREFSKYFDVYLLSPVNHFRELLEQNSFSTLTEQGAKVAGYFYNNLTAKLKFSPSFLTNSVVPLLYPNLINVRLLTKQKFDAIYVQHENPEYLLAGFILGKRLGIPRGILLQNPPFLAKELRIKNLLASHLLWRHLTSETFIEELLSELKITSRIISWNYFFAKQYKLFLETYDLILGISKATITEMGEEYFSKAKYLEQGIALDEEDLQLIQEIRKKSKEKKEAIVFRGNPTIEKGLLDSLIAFRLILQENSNMKLYITGKSNSNIIQKATKLCRKLGIADRVIFTGYLSRLDSFQLARDAKLVLHPSHMDAYSFSVIEALYLGTPVVGYNIPALQLIHEISQGLFLVEEGDIEALATVALQLLEQEKIMVEPPKMDSWPQVVRKEVELLRNTILT